MPTGDHRYNRDHRKNTRERAHDFYIGLGLLCAGVRPYALFDWIVLFVLVKCTCLLRKASSPSAHYR